MRGCGLLIVVDPELKHSFNLPWSSVTWGLCSLLPSAPPCFLGPRGSLLHWRECRARARRPKAWKPQAHRVPSRWLSQKQIRKHRPHFCAPSPQVIIWGGFLLLREEDGYPLLHSQKLVVSNMWPKSTNCIWMDGEGWWGTQQRSRYPCFVLFF